jgi:hypothetical protein
MLGEGGMVGVSTGGEQTIDVRGDVPFVVGGSGVCGTLGVGRLDHRVDEGAAPEVRGREPIGERVEDSEGSAPARRDRVVQPAPPPLVAGA